MVNFPFSDYFSRHFGYHSNGKSQINTRLLHLGYASNKLIRRIWKKKNLILGRIGEGGGGQNNHLVHIAFSSGI